MKTGFAGKKQCFILIGLFVAAMFFTTLIPQSVSAGGHFAKIVVLGDSWSDNGFKMINGNGYGFRRYSNGEMWHEYLAEMLGIDPKDDECYAWGGALSGQGNYNGPAKDWSGLLWQVQKCTPDAKVGKTLFVIEIGINDMCDGPSEKIAPSTIVSNVTTAMDTLIAKGAKNILVWNVSATVTFPGYIDSKYEWYSYYAPLLAGAKAEFAQYNSLLPAAIANESQKNPGVKIYFYDADKGVAAIAKNFANTTTPWFGSYLYPTPGQYLWYDDWHMMTEAHKYIAEQVYDLLKK